MNSDFIQIFFHDFTHAESGADNCDFFTKNPNLKFFFFGGGEGGRVVGGGVDGRTDEPANFFEAGGITMNKCTNYGPDKLKL